LIKVGKKYCNHWSCKQSPGKELEENNNKSMIEAWLPNSRSLQHKEKTQTYEYRDKINKKLIFEPVSP